MCLSAYCQSIEVDRVCQSNSFKLIGPEADRVAYHQINTTFCLPFPLSRPLSFVFYNRDIRSYLWRHLSEHRGDKIQYFFYRNSIISRLYLFVVHMYIVQCCLP